ncbi:kinase-like domain-containing protein [Cristinia sonorae]|uniref:Kinase-like domain-containing protein n=1 Tax=Cristinia sonorae TaxID=1940300 RepID=A0A8K0XUT5_9AGAR|nr:kinase-like domain-containing protein [Cristinia sonorae]
MSQFQELSGAGTQKKPGTSRWESMLALDPSLADIDPEARERILEVEDSEDPRDLHPGEIFWRDHQQWLQERGYMLRPRYMPNWVPPWKGTNRAGVEFEDGQVSMFTQVMDATRLSDGEMVLLKRVERSVHPHEIEITKMFSEEPLRSHPRNHCIPLLEVLDSPKDADVAIMVLPLLRLFFNPSFETLGEALEFFRQIFEGLQFMHQSRVAHRDCMFFNIMMDPRPMYPKMYHPISIDRNRNWKGTANHFTRTSRPVKYYLIDFGISSQYTTNDVVPKEYPIFGGDKTVPEFHRPDQPYNPFPTDIYYLGNVIRTQFLQKMPGLELMTPLVNDMVHGDPSKRPTIDEVVVQFEKLYKPLPWWKLRSRLRDYDESTFIQVVSNLYHFFRTTTQILTFRKAMPRPPKYPLHAFPT